MKSYSERKKIAKERYESYDDKTGFFPRAFDDYIKKIDQYDLYMNEVIRRTTYV